MGFATPMRGTAFPLTNLRGLPFLAMEESAVLQRPTFTADSGGGGTTTWSNVGTYAAMVSWMGGSPRLLAGRLEETSTHVLHVPFDAPVEAKDRVVVSGRGTFAITSVADTTNAVTRKFEVAQLV